MVLTKNNAINQQAVGVMDSGVGGISVLKHIHALLPFEDLIYFADSKYAPYGSKTPEEITARCMAIADFLIEKNVKALVVACNTATAAAIDALRDNYAPPDFNFIIIGMEPALKPAAEASANGIIGVLATVGTLKSAQFAALLESYGRNVKVVTQGCEGLVECIERGKLDAPNTKALIRQYIAPLLAEGADTIVLGCTHYPFVAHIIREVVGLESNFKPISLIDTGLAVAKQLKRQLLEKGLLSIGMQPASIQFYSNSTNQQAGAVVEQLWGMPADVVLIDTV
ncbi:MAG: glutamate racemase [Bdellovibrio sp.]|nr:glutamate racemase [Methylotenera sp.]